MGDWSMVNEESYEIRPIKTKALWHFNLCTRGTCYAEATHYLVHKGGSMSQAESRSRRCEACARKDSESLHIPFPQSSGFDEKMRRKMCQK